MLLNRRTLILAGLVAAAVSGCSVEPKVKTLTGNFAYVAQNPRHPLAGVVAAASQQIGWRLLVQGDRTGNQLASPASLCVALVLVGLGATGAFATSLDELSGMNSEDWAAGIGAPRAGLANYVSLPESIDAEDSPEKPIINLVSCPLICSDVQPRPPFLGAIRKHLGASMEKVKNSEAQASLGAWAKKDAAGLIEQSGIAVTHDTVLMVQDVLLFVSHWETQFKSDDAPLAFITKDGETMEIKALSDSFSVRTTSGQGWQTVWLLHDEDLAMDTILLNQGIHPLTWDANVLQETHGKLSAAPEDRVEVTTPPVDLAVKRNPKEELTRLRVDLDHLDDIFDGARVNQAAQQVRLRVNVRSTVGAALTEVEISVSAPANPPTMLVVNHPYVMWVLDARKGWPLFLAVTSDPEAK